MNMHDPLPTTPDEFLRWNAYREGKREFVKGQVVEMMINTTRAHAVIAGRLLGQLLTKLDPMKFIAASADFGVKTGDGVRYPDVFVELAGGDGKELATETPLLTAEVLFKSTAHIDFGEKAREYLQIDSLKHYLILSQDERAAWLWSRDPEGMFGEPELVTEENAVIDLSGFGISIALFDIYRGIV